MGSQSMFTEIQRKYVMLNISGERIDRNEHINLYVNMVNDTLWYASLWGGGGGVEGLSMFIELQRMYVIIFVEYMRDSIILSTL